MVLLYSFICTSIVSANAVDCLERLVYELTYYASYKIKLNYLLAVAAREV